MERQSMLGGTAAPVADALPGSDRQPVPVEPAPLPVPAPLVDQRGMPGAAE
jgi:hypothetical protein